MTPRIRELILDCTNTLPIIDQYGKIHYSFNKEEFARLLIEDVLDSLFTVTDSADSNWNQAVYACQQEIIDQFLVYDELEEINYHA